MQISATRALLDNLSTAAIIGVCTLSNLAFAASDNRKESELYVSGGITTVVQKISTSDPSIGKFGSALSADLFIEKGVFDGKALLYLNHSQGYNPLPGTNADYEGAIGGKLGDATYEEGFSDTRIAEAFYEAPLTNSVTVTVGMFSPQRYFDNNNVASDQTRQFLAYPFVNNSAIEFPGHRAIHAYPGGIRLSTMFGKRISLQGGLFEDAKDYSGTFGHTFAIAEAGLVMGADDAATNLRFIAWKSNTNETSGMALSADRNFNDEYAVFVRYGNKTLPTTPPANTTEKELADSLKTAFSLGGQAIVSHDFTVALGYCVETPNAKTLTKDTWIDGYVSYEVNTSVHIAVDYQTIKNKIFDHATGVVVPSTTVIAGRLQVDF